MPEMDGLELQEEIVRRNVILPVIVLTGAGDVPRAVRAMKAGAVDFIEKPFENSRLLASVRQALLVGDKKRSNADENQVAARMLARLSPREHDVLNQLMLGHPNKVAAFELGISPRTVEIHRAQIMKKLEARSLSDVVRTSLAAERQNQNGGNGG
jgi:two-component system response regulator FixJ